MPLACGVFLTAGFESAIDPSDAVLVVAATNRPEVLDPALVRPGRFDRHVHVGLPDEAGREAVLRVHARNVQMSDSVDLRRVARKTKVCFMYPPFLVTRISL